MMAQLDYKTLFSANRNPLLVLDDSLSIMAVNQAYMSATGISESKSLGHNVFEVFPAHPSGAGTSGEQKLRVSLARVLETGVTDEMAITKYEIPAGNSASGGFEEHFWKITNTPLLNSEGKLTHILVHAEDVTNFMQAESRHSQVAALELALEEQRASRYELQKIVDLTPVTIAVFKGAEHRYAITNPAQEQMLGKSVKGLTLREAHSEEERKDLENILDRIYEAGESFVKKEQLFTFVGEDGISRERWLNLSFDAVPALDGSISGILAVGQDVSEQVIARKNIEDSEQRLAHESYKLETIFHEAPAAMALWRGPDFVFEKVNPLYQAIFPDRDLVGKPFLEACPEFSDSPFVDYLAEVLASGKPFRGIEEYAPLRPKKDGPLEERYYDFTYLRINDADGNPYGIYDHAVDVTDRVRARKDLEFEQLKLKTVIENSTASIAVLRGANCVYEITNKSYAELFNNRDLIGRPLLEALPELADQEFPRHAQSVFETGIPYVEREAFALLRRTDSGPMEERYFDQIYSRILDQDGKPYGIFMHAQEVTDRVNARMELEEARTQAEAERQKLAAMIEVSPIGIGLMRGQDLVFEMVNDQFINLVGNRNYVGRKWQDVYAELPSSSLIPIMLDVLMTGKPYSAYEMPIRVEVEEGVFEQRYYDFTYAQVKDGEKKPYGVYLQCSNVTERVLAKTQLEENLSKLESAKYDAVRAREEAERANELKSAFLANMSHEIRTPLSAILGFSSLLKDENLSPEDKHDYIDTIIRSGTALTKIIDDILDLAKVEAGKLEVENVPLSLYTLATDAVDLFKDKAKEKGIFLVLNIDEAVPARISSDPTRLRQILVNLIGNAVKFTEKGGIRVNIRSEMVHEDRSRITIDVKDTGIGIEAEQRERLFQPFNQADNSTTRRFGGTGLGLALSQRLSRALSGDIRISSSLPGLGSTFTFTFYADLLDEDHIEDSRKSLLPESISLKGLKILVVDDSRDNQFLVSRLLSKSGAIVETAFDGQEGYGKALADSFDLILMDIQMPKMDGYEAKRALDQCGYGKPVVALTAHAMADERQRTKAAGFAAHLTKPLAQRELLSTIASLRAGPSAMH